MIKAADVLVVPAREGPRVRLASPSVSAPPVAGDGDRRQYSRRREHELDWLRSVRLRAGRPVALVDLSAGGALIDADVPLRPGAVLSLEIVGRGIEAVVPLQVLRCQVSALMADHARYRGALEFSRPIELPGVHSLPELSRTGGEAVPGVDAALKLLVERAYAAEAADRLAAGDVTLVLQSLARRAESAPDAPARSAGALVQQVLPAIAHGYDLGAALLAIERHLVQILPDTRIRLVDGRTAPAAGVRCVLVSPPGTAAAGIVSIDVPATAVISDAQARLLRTSSRLIALVQRLHGPRRGPGAAPADPLFLAGDDAPAGRARTSEPEPIPGGWQRIVARYADGQMLKGFTQDFHASKTHFSLWPSPEAEPRERVFVPLARLKAVFFVREFDGNPGHVEQKLFDAPAHGRRIEVTLLDGEVMVGTTLSYRPDSAGFVLFPADPHTNNYRVFVVSSAVRQVRFP